MSFVLASFLEISICAQCRYRLYLRQRSLNARRILTSSHCPRSFTTHSTIRGGEGGTSSAQPDSFQDDQLYQGSVFRLLSDYNSSSQPGNETLEQDPAFSTLLPPVYRRPLRFKEQSERLKIQHNTLGEPAKVLVIHGDAQKTRSKPLQAPDNADETWRHNSIKISGSEMLEQIARERGILGEETWLANIESLKAELLEKPGAVIENEKFDALRRGLIEGFTRWQLRRYIEKSIGAEATEQEGSEVDLSREVANSKVARTAWAVSRERENVPKLLEGDDTGQGAVQVQEKALKKNMSKRGLADHVLCRVWNVRSQEKESVHGEVGIRLQPIHFDLIVNHRQQFLKSFAESYGVKIEANTAEKLIWILSDREGCTDVWKSLCSVVEGIQCEKIRLRKTEGTDPSNKIWEAVMTETGKLTSTVVVPSPSSQV